MYAMDTVMTLTAYGDNAEAAIAAAVEEIETLDETLRRGSETSEIYRINAERTAEVSDETAEIIADALEICADTDGAFDVTIAPVMDLWGFYTHEYHVPTTDELFETLARVNYENVEVRGNTVTVADGAELDLGGIAKGYLSDRITEIFADYGVESGIVSLGGNVQTIGTKPGGENWRVAIQDPDDTSSYLATITVADKAVVTSGGYQRNFTENGVTYHHIINPDTGYPAHSGVKSVTIVSESGTLADGLSTALFVMGLDKGTEYWREHGGFDVVFVTDEDEIYVTEGIADAVECRGAVNVIENMPQ